MTCPYVSPLPLTLPARHPFILFLSFPFPFLLLSPNAPQAHIKSALIGASVSVPIMDGKLALGTWQGIWFLEFRNGKQRRKCVATVQGVGF